MNPPNVLPPSSSEPVEARTAVPQSARGISGPSGALLGVLAGFVLVVAAVMAVGQWRQVKEEPWRSPELAAARARLHADPTNEVLKVPVRELDRELRVQYFRNLERNRVGAWLLLAGGVALVGVGRLVYAAGGPVRAWQAPQRDLTQRLAGRTLLGVGLVSAIVLLVAGVALRVRLPDAEVGRSVAGAGLGSDAPRDSVQAIAVGAAAVTEPGPEELARNWPRFRGHDGSGHSRAEGLPARWDLKSGEGIVWKAAVPLKGYSSPIVWKDRVFLTAGDREQRRVLAWDAVTGVELWSRPVTPTNQPAPAVEPPDQSGQAASTAATDGERVYAIFATGELGALDFSGNFLWGHRLDLKDNAYGHASSLVAWRGQLFVQADQGTPEDGKSVLNAYDCRTGRLLWSAKRPVGGSWATPEVIEVGGRWQVVTAGDPWLMGHDAGTGAEIWRANVLGGELAPSPAWTGTGIVAISPGHAFSLVKADGMGDVTATHVTWKLESDVPDVPTPMVVGELLFTANTEGRLICWEWATGTKIWEHEFEVEIQASPVAVGEVIYLFGQPGNVWGVRAGRVFETVTEFDMGEEVYATPAVAGDRMYVRTAKQLVSVGNTGAKPQGGQNDVR